MRSLIFKSTEEGNNFYTAIYYGLLAFNTQSRQFSAQERRVHVKILDKFESIGVPPNEINKPYTLILLGGRVDLEEIEFQLMKDLIVNHVSWSPNTSRLICNMEDWFNDILETKYPTPTLVKSDSTSSPE